MFSSPCLTEEGVEGIVGGHLAIFVGLELPIGLYAVLEAVELPAGVAHLDTRLTHVNTDAFSLETREKKLN